MVLTLTFDTAHVDRVRADEPGGSDPTLELARVLRDAANRIERVGIDYNDPRPLRDRYGALAGHFEVKR